MTPSLPAPLIRAGLTVFGRLPAWVRRRAVHAGAPSYTVGAVLVLRDPDGRILLVRQRHTGGWALPGGLLRHGETPESAVTREVAEELGIAVSAESLPPPTAVVDPRARRVDLVFGLRPEVVEPTVDGLEVLDAQWFAPEAVPESAAGAVLRQCGIAPAPR